MTDFKALLNNPNFLNNSSQKEVFIYATLKGATAPPTQKRIPLNIALVIDRSGSMSGEKLAYVKKATKFVIDNLSPEDYLSIIQYDSEIDVVSASSLVTNKQELHKKVDKIEARGMTNLSGGMLSGYQQVAQTQKENYVNRVLLLTDGLANQGVTEPKKLQQIVQKKFREENIGLSTFGVGSDFNEALLTNLSEYGGGNYYFIESPDKIPTIFAQELKGLLAVVAQNTALTITLPTQFTCEKVYGYPANVQQNQVHINFNDVYAEEEKAIVLKAKLKESFFFGTKSLTENTTFTVALTYVDVARTLATHNQKIELPLAVITDKEAYAASINKEAMANVALFVSNDLFEQAVLAMDKRDKKKANQLLEQAKVYINTVLQLGIVSTELEKQLKEIETYEGRLKETEEMNSRDFASYQKMSKFANYSMRKKRTK